MTFDADQPNHMQIQTVNQSPPNPKIMKGWKKQSLVGKMWEIYWDPKQLQSTCSLPSIEMQEALDDDHHNDPNGGSHSTRPPSTTPTDASEEESDYEADWYDAHVKSYSPESDIFEVSFVGEEKIWKMKLDCDQNVRPIESSATPTSAPLENSVQFVEKGDNTKDTKMDPSIGIDVHWKDGVIGENWEIYWDASSSSTSQTDDNESFCSDWYEATIQSYCPIKEMFQISFLGEDQIYDMALTPASEVVRPSTRAWIVRTKFILNLTADQLLDENRNPISARTICNSMPRTTEPFKNVSIGTKSLTDEEFDMECYVDLLKRQLESKSILKFNPDDAPKKGGMVENSEEHAEYVASQIRLVLESCSWCHSTGVFGDSNDGSSMVRVEDLHSHTFRGVVLFIRTLFLDCDRRSRNRRGIKRPLPQSSMSAGSTSSKRSNKRRISNSRKVIWGANSNDEDSERDFLLNELKHCKDSSCTDWNFWTAMLKRLNHHFGINSKEFISSELIEAILQRLSTEKSCSYLSSKLANILVLFLQRTWSHFVEWINEVKLALGPVYATEFENLGFRMVGFPLEFQEGERVPKLSEQTKVFSLDDVSSCILKCRRHSVLKMIDLSHHLNFIEAKILLVKTFQDNVWNRIARGLSEPISLRTEVTASGQNDITMDDPIILEFSSMLQDPACLQSPVSPNAVTKSTIDHAIRIRKWLIKAKWVLSRRERFSTLLECYKHHVPTTIQLPSAYTSLYDSDHITETLNQLGDKHNQIKSVVPIHGLNCQSKCRKFLEDCMKKNLTIDISEEKIAVLADLFAWKARAEELFSSNDENVDFKLIISLHNTLQDSRKGMSKTRSKLTNGLLRNTLVDKDIQTFMKEQISLHCGELESLIANLFHNGNIWYKKANHVLRSLKHHGNTSVDAVIQNHGATKFNNFIELKAIDGLSVEYKKSSFAFPEIAANIAKASAEAHEWVSACLGLVPQNTIENFTPSNLLENFRRKCLCRPKGILMFPSRQLVGEWVELLDWYTQCSQVFDRLRFQHEKKSSSTEELKDVALAIVQTNHEVEKLLRRGYELILYSPPQCNSFHIDLMSMMNEPCLNKFKIPGPISLTKFKSCILSTNLLNALMKFDEKCEANGNFFILRLFVWRQLVSDVLSRIGQHSRRRGKQNSNITLVYVKLLLDSLDDLSESFESISKTDSLLSSIYLEKYIPLQQHIHDAQTVAFEVDGLLNQINTQRRTEITAEYVEDMLEHLKAVRTRIKNVNDFGLGIELAKSSEVEKRIRDLSWMKSVFSCPIISDTKYSSARRGISDIHAETYRADEKRVPLSLLVQIFQKAPSQCRSEVSSNACSLDVEMASSYTRISIVKEQLSEWKSKLHSFMPRSLRSVKRRDTQSRYLGEDALENYDIVSEEELRKLQQHPLLRYVSIPEEHSLDDSLRNTIAMRDKLIFIFAKDQCGHNVERIPLPSFASLVGRSGEYLLNRFIQHPLYLQLKKELASIDECAKNLPVKTLEKVTFDWTVKVLDWLKSVSDAIVVPNTDDEKNPIKKLCLTTIEVERLIEEGHHIFFSITEESKKYLLNHRLSVVTRESTGNVTIKRCKGASNLSIGGNVLRWVAFIYNGMRNDLASTLLWTKKAQTVLSNSQSSEGVLKSLSNLLEEAKENLAVAPKIEILENISTRLKESYPVDLSESEVLDSKPIHNLLLQSQIKKPLPLNTRAK